jgi:hypothetical protein
LFHCMVNWLPLEVWPIAQPERVMDVAIAVLARAAMEMRDAAVNFMMMVDLQVLEIDLPCACACAVV